MQIYKKYGKELQGIKSPRDVGESLKQHLKTSMFSDVTVSPQGFVTVKLCAKWLSEELVSALRRESHSDGATTAAHDGETGTSPSLPSHLLRVELQHVVPKTVTVDFSSPNIAKEMHVGHLRSTIIGECTCRILSYCGHRVNRINHVGDWGTQFGMLIEHMKEVHNTDRDSDVMAASAAATTSTTPSATNGSAMDATGITTSPLSTANADGDIQNGAEGGGGESRRVDLSDLQDFYKASKKRFDEDAEFKKRSQANVVLLQSGDPAALSIWREICEISRKEFQKVYDRLEVHLTERGESFYNDMLPSVIEELEEKGMVTVSSGAKCVFTEVDKIPLMVVKSDGGYGYDSTDMAAVRHRLLEMHSDWVVYITDMGQEDHFMKLFAGAEAAGWHAPPKTRLDHMGFGVVQGEDGKKFKTRSGNVVKLVDLLDEAASRALAEIKTRRTSTTNEEGVEATTSELTEEEMKVAAESIGYSAVKYFDLKQNRTTNYRFAFDKMLDPRGNTAVYMLYAYARICAVFRKANVNPEDIKTESLTIGEDSERLLCVMLIRLPEIVESILSDLHVHRLAEYMYELTDTFTGFYQKCKVIGSAQQESRLLLCELTRRVLEVCFYLLGIRPLERI
eukprot:GHVQ01010390.1.p1 GENE.GHVQ01010390.1~~GHVQ01010390.1.p1  ORF type:complete len:622 (+),score=98.87 GHVQ01010390.1:199-2064(+)